VASTDRPEVRTAAGTVRGLTADGVTVFRGIPFAAPPFGANRFRPPQAPQRWDGVRDAIEFGPGVPQHSLDPSPERAAFFNPTVTGEDCLNLNVWTPDPGRSGLPVMVWIHGGGYITGGGSAGMHDGTSWARDGVVYVSINYRMHVEGFVHFPGEPANLGLQDQVAALRWVQENIAGFGGDPGNVTIFGQSAGAVSVMHLLAMPSAAGLFRRAIAQSGSTLVTAPPAFFTRVRERLAELLGVEPTVDGFRTASIEQTLGAVVPLAFEYISPMFWGNDAFLISPFRPVIDGEVLPEGVDASVAAGSIDGVDLMGGCTRDEATFAMEPFGLLENVPDFWSTAALETFGVTRADLDAYPVPDGAPPGFPFQAAWTGWAFRRPTARLLDTHAPRPGGTFAYEFTWPSPSVARLGAGHALELPFVGDNLDAFRKAQPEGENPVGDDPPQELADRMHRAWIDFATTGDPGWAAYDPATRTAMEFGLESGPVEDWASIDRSLWP
jgi:para-nitrobenzyl esterase